MGFLGRVVDPVENAIQTTLSLPPEANALDSQRNGHLWTYRGQKKSLLFHEGYSCGDSRLTSS